MNWPTNYFRHHLWVQVVAVMALAAAAVMGVMIVLNTGSQTDMMERQAHDQAHMLAESVQGAMDEGLSTGNNDAVRAQFLKLKAKLPGVEVAVFDFDGRTSFATSPSWVGKSLDQIVTGTEAFKAGLAMLQSGAAPQTAFRATADGVAYLQVLQPVPNDQRCHHCHGASRTVLGGTLVRLPIDRTLAAIAAMRNRGLVVGLAGLGILILLLFVFFQRLINRPLKGLLDLTARISKGDLTARMAVSGRDEISHICNRMNDMAINLGAMFGRIKENGQTLTDAASQMNRIAHHASLETAQVSGAAGTVAAAAEQMRVTINAVAGAMDQAAADINTVSASAEQMSATIGEIAGSASRARQVTDEAVSLNTGAGERVNQLRRAAGQIGKVVESITDISEQVNLLALNATIEAARAGEAGRGFAVVANEIKELARQTAAATVEIKAKVAAIQSDTKETAAGIEGVSKVVTDINAIVATIAAAVEEQSVATREIAVSVSDAARGIAQVNEGVAQSSAASGQIAGQIAQVNQSTETISGGMNHLETQADEVQKLSEDLKAQMGRFTV